MQTSAWPSPLSLHGPRLARLYNQHSKIEVLVNIYSLSLSFAREPELRKADVVVAQWISEKIRQRLTPAELWEIPERILKSGMRLELWKTAGSQAVRALRLSHPDSRIPGRQWITEIGWSENWSGGGAATLSLSVRTEETSALVDAPPQVTRPKVVEELVRKCAFAAYVPGQDLKSMTDGHSAEAVRHVVTDDERSYALVLVSATDGGTYLADPKRLQSLLAGIAEIVVIPPAADTFAIGDVLGNQFRSWGGAVNIIFPSIRGHRGRQAPNRKLLPDQIAELQETGIAIETEVLHIITHRTNVLHLRRHISPETVHAAIVREAIDRNRTQAAETGASASYAAFLESEVIGLETKYRGLQHAKTEIEDLNLDLQQRLEDLEEEFDQLRHQCDTLKASLDAAKSDSETVDLSELHDPIRALAKGDPTPEQLLRILTALYPDRLVVLDSAWKSAREAAKFRHSRKLFDKLLALVDAYYDELSAGKGDAEARKVFGESYSARESEQVENNTRARELRTFSYKGVPVEMMQHVKIGVKDSAAETIRVHFKWDSSERKIVIGHCGPHLDFR